MRHFAMTGIVTACWIASIIAGSLMRATPPSRRMSAGTRSSAMTETAPASSAIVACSALTTSMITPPRSISASPRFTRAVPVLRSSTMSSVYRRRSTDPPGLPLTRRRRRRWCGHLDRGAHRCQFDPGATREELDRLPGRVDVLGRLLLRGPGPAALGDLPVAEDPHFALAHCLTLGGGATHSAVVVRELHDDVGRR